MRETIRLSNRYVTLAVICIHPVTDIRWLFKVPAQSRVFHVTKSEGQWSVEDIAFHRDEKSGPFTEAKQRVICAHLDSYDAHDVI